MKTKSKLSDNVKISVVDTNTGIERKPFDGKVKFNHETLLAIKRSYIKKGLDPAVYFRTLAKHFIENKH